MGHERASFTGDGSILQSGAGNGKGKYLSRGMEMEVGRGYNEDKMRWI
jgi:hypothetical protein